MSRCTKRGSTMYPARPPMLWRLRGLHWLGGLSNPYFDRALKNEAARLSGIALALEMCEDRPFCLISFIIVIINVSVLALC